MKAEQLKAIKLLAVPKRGGLTYEQIAKECGVDRSTLHRWRNDPDFEAEYMRECNRIIRDALADINKAAVDEFLANPDNAAMYRELNKVAGNVSDRIEVDAKHDVGGATVDEIRRRIEEFQQRKTA